MEAGGGSKRREPGLEVRRERIEQRLASRTVNLTHLPNVSREMPFIDERCERLLFEHRAVPVGILFGRSERPLGPAWRDDEAETDGGEQALRERADVEHRLGPIKRLQRIERAVAETELGVVIVFDHHRAATMGELQQRGSAP